jgi:hypothetical protein
MFGQNIFILGNTTDLGGMLDNSSAIILPLNPGNYTSTNPEWYVDIWLPAGQTFEYQYILQGSDPMWTFENVTRTVTNTRCGSSQVVLTEDVASFPEAESGGD